MGVFCEIVVGFGARGTFPEEALEEVFVLLHKNKIAATRVELATS